MTRRNGGHLVGIGAALHPLGPPVGSAWGRPREQSTDGVPGQVRGPGLDEVGR